MQESEVRRAVAAALSITSSLGLAADEAVVLQNSNKLTLRVLPGDVLARVAPEGHQVAQLEVDLARRLAGRGPVAALEPRVEPKVHEQDGFVVTLWTYYEPVVPTEVVPADYGAVLARLHRALVGVDLAVPHFTDRVDSARRLLADRERTPALAEVDRELLDDTLERLGRTVSAGGRVEQPLHGEPHPGNLLSTRNGLLFIDFETCCRGPVEFDLAHAPADVADHYPGVDRRLLGECQILVLAMITTWRWDRDDEFPDGRRLAKEWLHQLRAARDRAGPDARGRPAGG